MKNRSRPRLVLSLVLAMAGCTTWAPATHLAEVTPSPDQRILVWAGGSEYDLYGIEISDTALTGLPHWQSLQRHRPDENRVTIPLAEIDSIQQRRISTPRTAVLFGIPTAFMITTLAAFAIHGPPS